MKETRPFSMKDKIGYTLGDLGCCCTEQFRAMYLAIFYTLVLEGQPGARRNPYAYHKALGCHKRSINRCTC